MINKALITLPSENSNDIRMKGLSVIGIILCVFATLLEVNRSACPSDTNAPSFLFCEPQYKSLEQGASIFLLALGSALIGSGLSQLVSNRKARELLNEVSDAIGRTVAQPAIYSDSSQIAFFRKRYYSYHSTRMNGKRIWRVTIVDFTKTPAINRLECTSFTVRENGEVDNSYKIEAFVRGAHLVFVVNPSHEEPKYMRIYPLAGLQFRTISWGISTHMDFDDGRGLYKCLLSEEPIFNLSVPGLVDSENNIQSLDLEWKRLFGVWQNDLN